MFKKLPLLLAVVVIVMVSGSIASANLYPNPFNANSPPGSVDELSNYQADQNLSPPLSALCESMAANLTETIYMTMPAPYSIKIGTNGAMNETMITYSLRQSPPNRNNLMLNVGPKNTWTEGTEYVYIGNVYPGEGGFFTEMTPAKESRHIYSGIEYGAESSGQPFDRKNAKSRIEGQGGYHSSA